ncbi:YopX family protein [Candidatus Enterococcus clewellii]|uniref:YopX protein domain-containing protein n=1 Tax=Candidatus Enterococcus clewellii TaxID=1834193 RepID=A0A242K3X5_9ENTE|nr:YopX family protein [Enterococcus sp. 9E7_DIV0242]OTP13697.1 hypothetical protein A5888_003175 [Enterococcus sp. 9E7_DIV0242]
MRQIKFRCFHNDYGMFEDPDLINLNDGSIKYDSDWYDSKEIKLMQYTGLKDTNGVEIYEKDYVRFGGIIALVVWSDKYCQFRLDDGTATTSLNIHHKNDYEVIGNIWEDGDLLNDDKGTKRN